MNKNLLYPLLCTVAMLGGCQSIATMGGSSGPPVAANPDCPDALSSRPIVCGYKVCSVLVQVVTDDQGKCEVVVAYDKVTLPKGHGGANDPVAIAFWLPRGSKWEFRKETGPFSLPVNFKDQDAPQLREQFSQSLVLDLDRKPVMRGPAVWIYDKNTYRYQYDYRIKVFKIGSDGESIESKDPAIFNDGF